MSAYIVAYDLMKQGQNYDCIINRLKAYPSHWHMQQSVWILSTDQTAVQIRDNLKDCLDTNDRLFVGRLSGGAWKGMAEDASKWLSSILR